MSKKEALERLREGLLAFDGEALEKAAKKVLDEGLDPLEAINILITTMREIGDKYSIGQIFLPEMMMAANVMKSGTSILMSAIPNGADAFSHRTFLIGSVKGDVHDIGKNIVGTILSSSGFNVVDLGIDVAPSTFAEAAQKNEANIVGLSATMSTTIPFQRDVIDYFEALGIRKKYKIMVGGAMCTKKHAEVIGADGYGADAAEAVKVATNLLEKL